MCVCVYVCVFVCVSVCVLNDDMTMLSLLPTLPGLSSG